MGIRHWPLLLLLLLLLLISVKGWIVAPAQSIRLPRDAVVPRRQELVSRSWPSPTSTGLQALYDDTLLTPSVPFLVMVGLTLGAGAQFWIYKMVSGDKGLGAYLKDGRGLNRSAFSTAPSKSEAFPGKDPMPWYQPPRLDFVRVAGQEGSGEKELELLRDQMQAELKQGNVERATKLKDKLEILMKEKGFEYITNETA